MELRTLREFQTQVSIQCRYLLYSADIINEGVTKHDPRLTFYGIHNLLNAAANVTKALWGSGKTHPRAPARKPLRDSLGVTDSSPLKTTRVRDDFEHFDERIDHWWDTSISRNFVDMNVGIPLSGIDESDKFRDFNPATMDVTMLGQVVNIRELIDEARRILEPAERESQKSPWETTPPESGA